MAPQRATEDVSYTCRACLDVDKAKKYSSLLEEPLNSMYLECTSVEVRKGDTVSTVLCSLCVGRCEASKFFRDLAVQNDEELRRKFEGRVSSMTSSPEDTTGVVVQYDEAQEDNVGLVEGELLLESCEEEIEEEEMFMVSFVNTKEVEKAVKKTTHPPTQFTKTTTYNGRPVQNYVCEFCEDVFRYRVNLMQHYEDIHPDNVYKCKDCDKSFENPQTWRCHTCKVGNFCCEHCGMVYPHATHLKKHLETHGDIQFTCALCFKGFSREANYRRHMQRHSSEKKFDCQLCDSKFKEKRELVKHRQLVHSNHRPFQCSSCSRSFAFRYMLKRHEQAHTGLRTHKCTYDGCGLSLSSANALKHHMFTHTGAKPYECDYCQAAFRLKVNLNRHLKDTHDL